MSWQPTLIERLEVKHPGLEKDVCDWLKTYVPGIEIAARLRAKYSETVSPRTINNYKNRRLKRETERIHEQKIAYQAFMQAAGEEGLDAGAAAQLWEALQRMTPRELIALRRVQLERTRVEVQSKRADVDAQRVENEKRELALTLRQMKKPRAKGAAGGEAPNEPASAEEIRRRIREIYGLPDDSGAIETASAIIGVGQALEERLESDGSEPEVQSPKSEARTSDLGPPASDGSSGDGGAPAAPGDMGSSLTTHFTQK